MKWVGLTGGLASGKTTVSSLLGEWGVGVVHADVLAHQALTLQKDSIVAHFGPGVLDLNGKVHRRRLGEIVFSQSEHRKFLENLIHPLVRKKAQEEKKLLEKRGCPWAVYDVPLLFEKNMEADFEGILFIYAPEDICLRRLMLRNSLSPKEARQRICLQIKMEEKRKKAHWVIENKGSLEELRVQVRSWKESMDQKYLGV